MYSANASAEAPPFDCSPTRPPVGLILNIQRFALHDGPGLRTTVFLKGCPLCCPWCHNPESRSPRPVVVYSQEKCRLCGDCVRICPNGALRLESQIFQNSELCACCGECIEACVSAARQMAGTWMSVPEVVSEVVKDQVFFDESQGGVTISGGEPLAQASFVEALLAGCRSRGLRTALDTCGYGDSGKLRQISQHVNLFLFDVKLMDGERHKRFTGVPNGGILDNLRMLAAQGSQIIVRMPVIPGINDDRDNIEALGRFLLDTPLRRIDLLPYHRLALGKYKRLQLDYGMGDVKPPTRDEITSIAAGLREAGFDVRIGG